MKTHVHIPGDISDLYDLHDYRHAAAILACEFPDECSEVYEALRNFRFYETDLTVGGGNESAIPKTFKSILQPMSWRKEVKLKANLVVDGEEVQSDTHKIDYIKNRIALDIEWNSKDQTFDRDLYAFRAFFDFGRISLGLLVTRSTSLHSLFARLGILKKYGASTTHTEKLLPRLKAGRSGGCPVLVVGITEKLFVPAAIKNPEDIVQ